MQHRYATWLALAALTAFSTVYAAQAEDQPTPADPPPAADSGDAEIGPPDVIIVPQPEEVAPPADGEVRQTNRIGTGDLHIRAPYADVRLGDSDGSPRLRVQAPYADVRVDSRDGIHVDTPIGPIRIGGGGLNLRELGDRFGVRVERDGAAIDAADALPRRAAAGRGAVLGVQLRDDDGIRIESVRDGSPADKANLAPGDRVVSMNGYVFANAAEMTAEVNRLRPGDQVKLTIERDGRLYRASAVLEARQ